VRGNVHAPFWSSGRRRDPSTDCNGTRPDVYFVKCFDEECVKHIPLAEDWSAQRGTNCHVSKDKESGRRTPCLLPTARGPYAGLALLTGEVSHWRAGKERGNMREEE
jgi:hypothetical protein